MAKIIKWMKYDEKYDCAVSLGGDCQTAYQLDRLGLRGPAYPFDWLLLPFESLYKLLENKFDGFLEKKDLTLIPGKCVMDGKYGTLLLHDFKLLDGSLPDYDEHYEKYRRRIIRWLELTESSQRVLLIRRELKLEEATRLLGMLQQVYPRFRFGLLALDEDWSLPGVWRDRVAQAVPYRWRGINTEWDRVMARFKIPKVA